MKPHLLCFGFGYCARVLAGKLSPEGWQISATSRNAEGLAEITAGGFSALPFPAPADAFSSVTHILSSVPPDAAGDPVLRANGNDIRRVARQLAWAGYLSTTGVYGDTRGGWVDENSPLAPNTERGRRRLRAEEEWLLLHENDGVPVHLFRLPGIYGPGRNQLLAVSNGTAKRIVKEGQVFSRVHVEDIAGTLMASMAQPHPGRAYNVCDDEPCPPQDVVSFAARLLDKPLPPEVPFEEAELSPMARSFYADSKRVSNARIKAELGYHLLYPDYRAGLKALALQAHLLPRAGAEAAGAKTGGDPRP